MLVGRFVLVYRNGHGFTKPLPGIVAAEREGDLVDVNVSNSALSNDPPTLALANVKFCRDVEAAVAAMADEDIQDVCGQYDPANPEAFDYETIPAPSQEKPAKKPNKKA